MSIASHRDAPAAIPIGPVGLISAAARALDHSGSVLIVLDPSATDPTIVGFNGAFGRVFGQTAEAVLGQPFSALAADDNDPTLPAQIAEAVAERRSLQTEMRCLT